MSQTSERVPQPSRTVPPLPRHTTPLSHKPCARVLCYQFPSVCCAGRWRRTLSARSSAAAPAYPSLHPTPPTQVPASGGASPSCTTTLPVCVGSFCTPLSHPSALYSTSDPFPSAPTPGLGTLQSTPRPVAPALYHCPCLCPRCYETRACSISCGALQLLVTLASPEGPRGQVAPGCTAACLACKERWPRVLPLLTPGSKALPACMFSNFCLPSLACLPEQHLKARRYSRQRRAGRLRRGCLLLAITQSSLIAVGRGQSCSRAARRPSMRGV